MSAPMRGIRLPCARAASGHAVAAPSSVMNSRRLMGLPQGQDHGLSIADQARASQQNGPPNVRYGSEAAEMIGTIRHPMSALPQKRTNWQNSRYVRFERMLR